MPDGPQLIFTDNPGSLPATYTIPPGISLEISSVFALIDGSGAAADFLPCLTILSQDDKVVARVKQDDTYATGDTGDATWSPFLRTPGSSTPPPPGSFAMPAAFLSASLTTVGALESVPWSSFQTNDLSVFGTATTAGGAVTNTSGDVYLRGLAAGFYMFIVTVKWYTETDNQGHGVTSLASQPLTLGGSYAGNVINTAFFDHTNTTDLYAVASGTEPGRWFVEVFNGNNSDADVDLAIYYWPGDDLAAVY